MKKIIYILAGFTILFILASATSDAQNVCDSPIVGDHSGAPGESNCTGCHAETANTGTGILTFQIGNNATYVPGNIYNVYVSIARDSFNKFGFVTLALKDSDSTTIGTFNLIDSVRTRKYSLGGRNYFSHTPCGADADTVGMINWHFSWQAPSTNVGNITIYLSALAANHNHNTSGDETYTNAVTLQPTLPTGVYSIEPIYNTKVTPTLFDQSFAIDFNPQNENENKSITLFSVEGQKVLELTTRLSYLEQAVSSTLSSGMYILKIDYSNRSECVQLMKR